MPAPEDAPTPTTPRENAGGHRRAPSDPAHGRRPRRPSVPPRERARAQADPPPADSGPIPGLPEAPTPLPVAAASEVHERYERAFAGIRPPFAFLDLDAVWSNAADMLRRAGGKQIRIATDAIRCRPVLRRLLDLDPAFDGALTFTAAETLWLWEQGVRDLVLAHPSTDFACLTRLARITAEHPDEAPVLVADSVEHLDLIERAASSFVAPVRVAIDVDLSWRPLAGLVAVGPRRSTIRTADQAAAFAREIERRERVRLAGIVAYERQIAAVPDDVPGRPVRNAGARAMKAASLADVRARRAEIVAAVGEVCELEFVNGGGTGSIELSAAEGAVTEVAAGSGFYAPAALDDFRSFRLTPAAMHAFPVDRRPSARDATVSGAGAAPYLPPNLRIARDRGGPSERTTVTGFGAEHLALGDRVYFRDRHAAELGERFDRFYLLAGSTIRDEVPTYRGEGRAFH
jgi:D-serine deaminase-like pyridoxal phosphate-dependent protein